MSEREPSGPRPRASGVDADRLVDEALDLRDLGQTEAALERLEAALVHHRAHGPRASVASTLNHIGWTHHRDDPERALGPYQEALAICRSEGGGELEAILLQNIGDAQRALGQHQPALASYREALEIWRTHEDLHAQGLTLEGMAGSLYALGEHAEELAHRERALAIARQLESGDERYVLRRMGMAYETLGKPRQALVHYQQALALRPEGSDDFWDAFDLDGAGWAHLELGEYSAALRHHQRALSIYRALGERGREARTLGRMARAHSGLSAHHDARECHEQQRAIEQELGRRDDEA